MIRYLLIMYNVAIIGLGIYGSLVAKFAAERGLSVIAFDKNQVPNKKGSSHGDSRLFRYATLEDERYVDIAKRSAKLWLQMDKDCGESIVSVCGTMIAAETGAEVNVEHGVADIVGRSSKIAHDNAIEHQTMSGAEALELYPNLPFNDSDSVYYEPGAFGIQPELALKQALADAVQAGAKIYTKTQVQEVNEGPGYFSVVTNKGSYKARKIVYALGPWAAAFSPAAIDPATVYPQVVALLRPELFKGQPTYVRTTQKNGLFYGVPGLNVEGSRAKVGIEQYDIAVSDPDTFDEAEFMVAMETRIENAVENAGLKTSDIVDIETCLYTLSSDSKLHVRQTRLHAFDIRCCSGHGFKYAPAIAEGVAKLLAEENQTTLNDSLLKPVLIRL